MKSSRITWILILLGLAGIVFAILLLRGENPGTKTEAEHTEESGGHHDEPAELEEHGEDESGGRASVALSDSALRLSGGELDVVATRRMAVRLPLQGKILLNEDRAAHIHPRFPGVVLTVHKQLGERVRAGEVLATVESNESLQPYEIRSGMNGTVIQRHASAGETVTGEDELFTVADLSTVWVDFQVYRQDFNRLRRGQKVRITAEGLPPVEARLAYLSPNLETHSQTLLARAEISNARGVWTPGLFVQGEVAVEEFEASAVRLEGVQQLEGASVLFVREKNEAMQENRYVAYSVQTGRRDGDYIEILSGPPAGSAYVSKNSFLLKAELSKDEAEHEH